MTRVFLYVAIAMAVLAACGDDGGATESGADADASQTESPSPPGDSDGDGDDAAPPPNGETGGVPTGTATVDGTEYTIVADVQCLVAIEQANQISISGTVEGLDSGERVDWAYAWDSDDGVNEFRIAVSDDLEYRTFDSFQLGEPQVDGQSVTASGTLTAQIDDPVDASFQIDCAG